MLSTKYFSFSLNSTWNFTNRGHVSHFNSLIHKSGTSYVFNFLTLLLFSIEHAGMGWLFFLIV